MTGPRRTTLLVLTGLLLSLATLPGHAKQKILQPEQAFRYNVVVNEEAIIGIRSISHGVARHCYGFLPFLAKNRC